MNWDKYINDFKSHLQIEKSLSDNSTNAYIQDVRKLAEYAIKSNISAINISKKDISNFLNTVHDAGISARSQSRILSGVKNFYKYLILENYITNNPVEFIESPSIGLKLPDVLSIIEIDNLINSINTYDKNAKRNKAILEILYSCGLRVSELINLKISNIRFKESYLKIIGKGNKERLAPIGNKAAEILIDYIDNVRNKKNIQKGFEDVVFINNRGKNLSRVMIYLIIKKCSERIGMKKKISPHTFRHSFASHLVDGGANLRAVQEMLGHESITTTEIYTHLNKEYLRDNIIEFHPRNWV